MTTLYQTLGLEGGGVVSIVGAGGKTSLMFRVAHELRDRREPVLTTTTTKIMMPTATQCRHVILATSVPALVDRAAELLKKSCHLCAASPREPEHEGKIIGFRPDCITDIWRCGIFRWIIVEADGALQKPLKVPAAHEPVIPASSSWVIGVVGLTAIGKPLSSEWVFRHERYAAITGLALGRPVTVDSLVTAILHPEGLFKGSPPRAEKVIFLNAVGKPRLQAMGGRLAQKTLAQAAGQNIRRVVVGSPLNEASRIDCYGHGE